LLIRTVLVQSFFVGLSLTLASACGAQTRPRQPSSRTVYAEKFPGGDLGAKIDAADRSLGAAKGEIVARGGGTISTQVVISGNHTLRLMPGVYAPAVDNIPILLKPGSSLMGQSWDAIILESTAKGQFTVVSAYNNAQRNGSADSDIQISNVQIKGANAGFNSAPQAISLGNCSACRVDHVWINGTRSIGIQLGGAGFDGNFARDSQVVDCLFTHVASQNLALVNGRGIVFSGNRFIGQGQAGGPGSTAIDLEPNGADDYLENVIIRDNFIDARDSGLPTAGNGIVIQATSGTPHVGPIVVEGNTIIGGATQGVITNKISNGLYSFGPTIRDVTFRNNRVTRTGQSGIHIEGRHFTVIGNQFTDVGGGGNPGFYMADVTDSQITDNSFTYSGQGPADGSVTMAGRNRNNVIRNNRGFGFPAGVR